MAMGEEVGSEAMMFDWSFFSCVRIDSSTASVMLYEQRADVKVLARGMVFVCVCVCV